MTAGGDLQDRCRVHGPSVDVDALASAARYVQREWGEELGYRASIAAAESRLVVLEVSWPRDGSRFYVSADRWGNVAHADTLEELAGRVL